MSLYKCFLRLLKKKRLCYVDTFVLAHPREKRSINRRRKNKLITIVKRATYKNKSLFYNMIFKKRTLPIYLSILYKNKKLTSGASRNIIISQMKQIKKTKAECLNRHVTILQRPFFVRHEALWGHTPSNSLERIKKVIYGNTT